LRLGLVLQDAERAAVDQQRRGCGILRPAYEQVHDADCDGDGRANEKDLILPPREPGHAFDQVRDGSGGGSFALTSP